MIPPTRTSMCQQTDSIISRPTEIDHLISPKIGESGIHGGSQNVGTPGSPILKGFSIINHQFCGIPMTMETTKSINHPPVDTETILRLHLLKSTPPKFLVWWVHWLNSLSLQAQGTGTSHLACDVPG